MNDIESIYHPGRSTTLQSKVITTFAKETIQIKCGVYCQYDLSWKLVENSNPAIKDKILISVAHKTKFPFDIKVKLIANLLKLKECTETRTFPLSVEPGVDSVIEMEESNLLWHISNFQSCKSMSFQLEVFDFDYVGTVFATEVNVENPLRTHDVVICVDEKKFYVMSAYICAWSDWFAEQVYEKKMSEITLEDVDPKIFCILLNTIHPNINIKRFENRMHFILPLARRLKMSRLVDLCTNRLTDIDSYKNINVMERLKIATECRNNKLKYVCLDAFEKCEHRDQWVQDNQTIVRNLPQAINLKLIMIAVKDREVMLVNEDNDDDDDEIEILEKEFCLTDQSRKHNKILVVEGKRFFVDTVYLATWSQYFDTMFYGVFAEGNKKDEIVLEHGTETIFNLMLQIMYTKRAELITDENVLDLLELAFYYQVHSIVGLCGKYLMDMTKVPDLLLLQRLQLADTYRHLDLLNFCLETIQQSHNKVELVRQYGMRLSLSTQRNLMLSMLS